LGHVAVARPRATWAQRDGAWFRRRDEYNKAERSRKPPCSFNDKH
jgi:hypothetical protein